MTFFGVAGGDVPMGPPEAGVVIAGQDLPEPPEPPDLGGFYVGHEGSRLGVVLSDVTPDSVKELKLPAEAGAIVREVQEGSPAAKAGLEKNDVILQFAGERVRSVAQLTRLVRETPPGRSVNLEISRGGQTRTLSAKLEASKDQFYFNTHVPAPHVEFPRFKNFNFVFRTGPSLGISGDELTTQLANYFGVKQGKGVLVREVVVGSAAEKAGLKAGDVIVQVEGKPVSSVGELRHALEAGTRDEKRKLSLTIVRDRREQTVTVELEKPATIEPRKLAENAVRAGQDGLQKHQADLQRELQLANAQATKASLDKIRQQLQRQQYELQRVEKEYQRQVQEQIRLALERARLAFKLSAGEDVI
jgi:membrane-associated protease RseP (regulator of RpoE activity)